MKGKMQVESSYMTRESKIQIPAETIFIFHDFHDFSKHYHIKNIYPVLMYGREAWLLTSDIRKCLKNCEVKLLRRMMRVSVDR